MARKITKPGKAYYEGATRRTIGGVPCRVARKPGKGSWYTPTNAFTRESTQSVLVRQRQFAIGQMKELGIEWDGKGCPVAHWIESYKALRIERGDVIPVYEDNALDVDMFTGEATIPAHVREAMAAEDAARAALVAMGVTPGSDPVAQLAAIGDDMPTAADDVASDDAEVATIPAIPAPLDMVRRHTVRPATVAKREAGDLDQYGCQIMRDTVALDDLDEWGCYRMVGMIPTTDDGETAGDLDSARDDMPGDLDSASADMADDLDDPITDADLRAYWQEQSLVTYGKWDGDWCEAMHDLWSSRPVADIKRAQEAAQAAGDVTAAWMARGYLMALYGARMAA